MSHPHSPEPDPFRRRESEPVRSPFADVAGRFANWLAGVDRIGDETDAPARPGLDPHDEVAPSGRGSRFSRVSAPATLAAERPAPPSNGAVAVADEPEEEDDEPEVEPEPTARFPLAPLGYNRTAVDEQLARLERELSELRAVRAPAMSITEELEWIGEQTASILVVAHDKAHETTRRAQEQAERTVAEATANAQAITEEARRRLSELDAETDQVWRERERLLDDVRIVSAALAELADEASGRFPAAEGGSSLVSGPGATVAFNALDADALDADALDAGAFDEESGEDGRVGWSDPEATRPFSAIEEAEAAGEEPDATPED